MLFVVPKIVAIPKFQPHPSMFPSPSPSPLEFSHPFPLSTLTPSPTPTPTSPKINIAHPPIASICPCRRICAIFKPASFCAALSGTSKAAARSSVSAHSVHLCADQAGRVVGRRCPTACLWFVRLFTPGTSRGVSTVLRAAHPHSIFFGHSRRSLVRAAPPASQRPRIY